MKLTMEKSELGKTNRLTRFMGPVSVLQLRIKKELLTRQGDALVKALARRFVLCGRIFLPFHAKENKVYLVEINADFERTPVPNLGGETRLSWDAFISWHNPPELNAKQVSYVYLCFEYVYLTFSPSLCQVVYSMGTHALDIHACR